MPTESTRTRQGLQSRVGRRTLTLLVLCALAPVSLLAGWSWQQVRGALLMQAQERVDLVSKSLATGIIDRTVSLRDLFAVTNPGARTGDRLLRIWHGSDSSTFTTDSAVLARVRAGGVAMLISSTPPAARLVRQAPGETEVYTWADVELDKLLGVSAAESADPAVCVFTSRSRSVLRCSQGVTMSEREALARHLRLAHPSAAAPSDDDFVIASRAAYLRYEVGADDLMVVAFRRKTEVLAAISGFGRTFLLVTLLTLLIVFVASHVQTRRITAPLDALTRATEKVGRGDFLARVDVRGNDEFAFAAASFNAMSTVLGRQFSAMSALDEVDRTALGGQGIDAVVEVALRRVASATSARCVAVTLPVPEVPDGPWVLSEYAPDAANHVNRRDTPAPNWPRPSDRHLHVPGTADRLAALGVQDAGRASWLLLPLVHDGVMEGVMAVGTRKSLAVNDPEAEEARRIADRLAVALANVRLMRQLDAFSTGTLTAFARVVDANSLWTAGHSERVTATAVAIGVRLGLTGAEVDRVRRGGLLHDMGKIGVPASVLDKPARLTDAEYEVIKGHAVLGYRILSPIPALRDVLPIVRSHHERMDGTGYPDGLAGVDIPLMARIVAVADVYDALSSDRPYRDGLSQEETVDAIRRLSGPHLDPAVVQAFLQLHAEGALQNTDSGLAVSKELVEMVGARHGVLEVGT